MGAPASSTSYAPAGMIQVAFAIRMSRINRIVKAVGKVNFLFWAFWVGNAAVAMALLSLFCFLWGGRPVGCC
jgi:hypothetical protein